MDSRGSFLTSFSSQLSTITNDASLLRSKHYTEVTEIRRTGQTTVDERIASRLEVVILLSFSSNLSSVTDDASRFRSKNCLNVIKVK